MLKLRITVNACSLRATMISRTFSKINRHILPSHSERKACFCGHRCRARKGRRNNLKYAQCLVLKVENAN